MYKITFIALLLIAPASLRSQSFAGANPHDSLLFDGDGANSFNFLKPAHDKCKINLREVFGEATGTYLVDTVSETCGQKKSTKVQRTGQLKRGVELVPGYEITTGGGGPTGENLLMILDIGSATMLIGRFANIMIGKDCVIHVNHGFVEMNGEYDISTPRSKVSHKKTQYTIEVVQDGDKITDIVKVYEGSVEFMQNFEGSGFKKGTQDWQEEIKKLNEDLKNGKITAEEYKEKFAEIQNKIKSNISTDPNYFVTVNAGNMSSITDANKPTDPVPFDVNADRWWENIK